MQQNTKWTPEEDEKLMAAVKKHGTQWGLVGKEINHTRTQNAIIKRWHGYLRRNLSNEYLSKLPTEEKPSETSKNKVQKKRKISSSEENEEMMDESQQRIFTQRQNIEKIKRIMEEPFEFKLIWVEEDDIKFKELVISEGVLFWDKLATAFNTTQEEVMTRWIKYICPKLKNNVKIGGALKWSVNEDYILYAADRNKISHLDLMFFLPYRTVYSIEARWRRIYKNSDLMDHLTIINERSNIRKQALKKIAVKKCLQKRDEMTKIYQKQKQAHEKMRQEQEKYDMMKRQDKIRKLQRL